MRGGTHERRIYWAAALLHGFTSMSEGRRNDSAARIALWSTASCGRSLSEAEQTRQRNAHKSSAWCRRRYPRLRISTATRSSPRQSVV